MADSASEVDLESDTSSVEGGPISKAHSPGHPEHLQRRIESLLQENKTLKLELETCKQRCKQLQEENHQLRRNSVTIQARAEQEEEFISNNLFKVIHTLKKEKETLAVNYEKEEEYLTNDLSRKLMQLRKEKVELEQTLEKEQEYQVNKLTKKIERLEADILSKQANLEQLRREKVELENSLEQEQEALVNRLWKRMEKLETEKRMLQEKLDQPISAPPSPHDVSNVNQDMAGTLSQHIGQLRAEVARLKSQLVSAEAEHISKMAQYAQEEKHAREENLRLQRKLQMEIERRENLCRHLSESESSLEMDDERLFNELSKAHDRDMRELPLHIPDGGSRRARTVSSPIPYQSSGSSRPLSPGGLGYGSAAFSPPSPMRGAAFPVSMTAMHSTSPPVFSHLNTAFMAQKPRSMDKFVKPTGPPPPSHTPPPHSSASSTTSEPYTDMPGGN